jgi:hypothetical protein
MKPKVKDIIVGQADGKVDLLSERRVLDCVGIFFSRAALTVAGLARGLTTKCGPRRK